MAQTLAPSVAEPRPDRHPAQVHRAIGRNLEDFVSALDDQNAVGAMFEDLGVGGHAPLATGAPSREIDQMADGAATLSAFPPVATREIGLELLAFLRRLHAELLRHGRGCVHDKSDDVHRHKLGLYCSMIEFGHAIIVLADQDAKIGIPVTLRALLEAAVDLTNLCNDEGYLGNIRAADEEQWRRLYKAAESGGNPFLLALKSTPDFDKARADTDALLEDLRGQGRGPLKVRERFRLAGLADEYDSVYNALSRDAHSNTTALHARHIEFAGDDFAIACHRDRPIDEFASALHLAAVMLLNASRAIHAEFNPPALPALESLVDEFADVQSRYSKQH